MADKPPGTKELRAMSNEDIHIRLEKLRSEIWQARQKTAEGAQTQTHHVSARRRQVARIFTLLNERRLEQQRQASAHT